MIARHALRVIFSEFSVGENADFEQRFKTGTLARLTAAEKHLRL